ncbi:hypothetical protein D3C78_1570220 [compost metagenome]
MLKLFKIFAAGRIPLAEQFAIHPKLFHIRRQPVFRCLFHQKWGCNALRLTNADDTITIRGQIQHRLECLPGLLALPVAQKLIDPCQLREIEVTQLQLIALPESRGHTSCQLHLQLIHEWCELMGKIEAQLDFG